MKTLSKIEKLNKYVDGSLSFTHFTIRGWDISSYKAGSLFEVNNSLYELNKGYLHNKNFVTLIDIAYEKMLEDKKKKI